MVLPGHLQDRLIVALTFAALYQWAILLKEQMGNKRVIRGWDDNDCDEERCTTQANVYFLPRPYEPEAVPEQNQDDSVLQPGIDQEMPTDDEDEHYSDPSDVSSYSHVSGLSDVSEQKTVYLGNTASREDPIDQVNRFPYVVGIYHLEFPFRVVHPFDWDLNPTQAKPLYMPDMSCTGMVLTPHLIATNSHCIVSPMWRYLVVAGSRCRPEVGGIMELAKHGLGTTQVVGAKFVFRRWPNEVLPRAGWIWKMIIRYKSIIEDIWMPFDLERADLAVLQLREPLELASGSAVDRVHLIEDDQCQDEWDGTAARDGGSRRLTMAGWGVMDVHQGCSVSPSRLQWFDLEHPDLDQYIPEGMDRGLDWALTTTRCNGTVRPTDGFICYPLDPGVSPQACVGDSGSPLVRRGVAGQPDEPTRLIGVLSSGMYLDEHGQRHFRACGEMGVEIFVRLCGETLQWLKDQIQMLG